MGFWTPEQDNILREMAAAGKSASQIGAMVGKSRNAVCGRAHRIGANLAGFSGLRYTHSRRGKRQKLTAMVFKLPKDRKAPPVTPAFRAQERVTDPLNLTILEVRDGLCRYPVTRDRPFLFCGHATNGDQSYCGYHHAICHQPRIDKRRAA